MRKQLRTHVLIVALFSAGLFGIAAAARDDASPRPAPAPAVEPAAPAGETCSARHESLFEVGGPEGKLVCRPGYKCCTWNPIIGCTRCIPDNQAC